MDKKEKKEKKEPTPLDRLAAINRMRTTEGWTIFYGRVSKVAEDLFAEITRTNLRPGKMYTKRDLIAYQIELMKKVTSIPIDIEHEAQAFDLENKEPHIGAAGKPSVE